MKHQCTLPARAFSLIVGTIRRRLDLSVQMCDARSVVGLGAEVERLAHWHRVLGFVATDPLADLLPTIPGGRSAIAEWTAAAGLLEVANVLARLHSANIPAIPLKGPLLGVRLHGNTTVRSAHDTDLLVPLERIDDAIAALAPEYCPVGWSRRTRQSCEHHERLRSLTTGRPVELHWQLLNPQTGCRIGHGDAWVDARPLVVAGIPHLGLATSVEAVFVAVHAAHHFGYRLHWLADVAALTQRLDENEWRVALELATRWRVRRAMLTGIDAAARVIGMPLPAVLADAVRRGSAHGVAEFIASRLADGFTAVLPTFRQWPHRLNLLDDWHTRLRVTTLLAFTLIPEDRAATRLPAWADPLTAALRPLLAMRRAWDAPRP
ncbi:MAG: nucleotidyltransferase family protein [Gemmatimonadota bacterium]